MRAKFALFDRTLASGLALSACFSLLPPLSFASADLALASKEAKVELSKKKNLAKGKITEAQTQAQKDVKRLPATIKPSAYELTIEPDLEKFSYSGQESISIVIEAETKEIELNALEMNVESAELEKPDGQKLAAKIEMDPANEVLKLSFPENLPAAAYKLHLKFNSILNDQLRGFYRSYFKDNSGAKHWLCSTQMEPADARRMFPCFDEPEF
ncbi:MAG: hypothetical protein K2X27_00935, partial [Candidatus Obscuribacterales bacterium]|nr:hypothetical protein [Candidatus Obscuribacterales bacterium]